MPRVSVVIPTYNRADFLHETVESVLTQDFEDFEVIIVDDCSSDSTGAVVDSIHDSRLRYIRHEENRGGSAARNTGIRVADGEYTAFLDDDDRWRSDKLRRQVADIEGRGDDWIATYCDHTKRSDAGNPIDLIPSFITDSISDMKRGKPLEGGEELIPQVLAREFPLGGASTLMIETELAQELGGFNESFPRHQDWEFLIRVLKVGKIGYVDEPMVTKSKTGYPSSEALEKSKELLLSEFATEVAAAEAEGYDVTGLQRFDMVRCHLMNGEFLQGIKRVPGAKIDIVALFRAVLIGLHATVTARADR